LNFEIKTTNWRRQLVVFLLEKSPALAEKASQEKKKD
jgi:hypothetical protein